MMRRMAILTLSWQVENRIAGKQYPLAHRVNAHKMCWLETPSLQKKCLKAVMFAFKDFYFMELKIGIISRIKIITGIFF